MVHKPFGSAANSKISVLLAILYGIVCGFHVSLQELDWGDMKIDVIWNCGIYRSRTISNAKQMSRTHTRANSGGDCLVVITALFISKITRVPHAWRWVRPDEVRHVDYMIIDSVHCEGSASGVIVVR